MALTPIILAPSDARVLSLWVYSFLICNDGKKNDWHPAHIEIFHTPFEYFEHFLLGNKEYVILNCRALDVCTGRCIHSCTFTLGEIVASHKQIRIAFTETQISPFIGGN